MNIDDEPAAAAESFDDLLAALSAAYTLCHRADVRLAMLHRYAHRPLDSTTLA